MQAIFNCLSGKRGVVFLAGEAFFLRSSDNLAVNKDHGSTVMIKGREAQNVD